MNEKEKHYPSNTHTVQEAKKKLELISTPSKLKECNSAPKSLGFWGDFKSGVTLSSSSTKAVRRNAARRRGGIDDVRCNTEQKRGLR